MAADEITRLTAEVDRIQAALSWISPPFVDERTPEAELRQRIGFCVADAALTQPAPTAWRPIETAPTDGTEVLAPPEKGGE
jgi:hypothetical protein